MVTKASHSSYNVFLHDHLKGLGITKGCHVLDFGCGEGNYTVHLSNLVGSNGKVCAADEDETKLKILEKKANTNKNHNIHTFLTDGNLKIPSNIESIDFTLLYNVTCCIIGKDNFSNFHQLVKEISHITRPYGKIIIGIKEGKTMRKRIETAILKVRDYFILEKQEKGKYFDGSKLRYGRFYHLSKT